MERGLYEEDLEIFRELAVEFNSREVALHYRELDHGHMMSRKLWNSAGGQGHLHLAVPEELPLLPLPNVACRPCAKPSAGIAN